MPSLFSRSHQPAKKDRTPAVLVTNPSSNSDRRIVGLAKTWNGNGSSAAAPPPSNTVGEFGTVPNASPGGGGTSAQRGSAAYPRSQPGSPDVGLGHGPNASAASLLPQTFAFLSTNVPLSAQSFMSNDNMSTLGADEIRQYGFLGGAGRNVVLGLDEVARVMRDVGAELARRSLDTPLLFSNQSLELNQTRMKLLIQTFLRTVRTSTRTPTKTSMATFAEDVTFASDQELAWLLRWALSRMTRVREPAREICHGCLDWEMYEEWRGRERASKYPFDAFPNLATILPADVYHYIIQPLFSLLSRFAAHSHNSGLTPHALASFFAPLLFDIPTSVPCMSAHRTFVRAASATEHMLLAYIRSSGNNDGLGVTDLPFRLQEWVKGYPSMVASDIDLSRGRPRHAARVVRCEIATRIVRAYSRDLAVTAETWVDDIPQGWNAWERIVLKQRRGEASRPKFSPSWRRKMAVKETLPLPTSRGLDEKIVYGAPQPPRKADQQEEGEIGKYASMAGKQWSAFEECGFDSVPRQQTSRSGSEPPDTADINKRLQFDLNESAKQSVTERRQTMDWGQFADGGFTRTEPFLTASLTFSAPVQTSITEWPKERDELRRRLEKTQKEAVPFTHNTTPLTGPAVAAHIDGCDQSGRVYVEEAFVDCWSDFMMGTGWADRAELTFKRSNWAIIEYRARPSRPAEHDAPPPSVDPRTAELYFLFEEYVPLDYQMAVADPKRKKTLGKLFTTKKKKAAAQTPPQPFSPRDDFDKMLSRTTQRKLTIPRSDQSVSSQLWNSLSIESQAKKAAATAAVGPPTALTTSLPSSPSMQGRSKPGMSKSATASPLSPDRSDDQARIGNGRPGFLKSIRRVKSGSDNRDKAKKQREVSMDFEVQSASGLSSGTSSPQDGDEKWMDILIANGARKMDATSNPLPAVRSPPTSPTKLGLPAHPNPNARRGSTPPSRSNSTEVTPTNTRFGSSHFDDATTTTTTASASTVRPPKSSTNSNSTVRNRSLEPPVQLTHLSDNGPGHQQQSEPSPLHVHEKHDSFDTEPDFDHAIDKYSQSQLSSSAYDGSSQHTTGSTATTGESVQPSDSISMRRRSPPASPRDAALTPQPRDSVASAYDGIVAPQPRMAGERDAIFSIVDHYRDSAGNGGGGGDTRRNTDLTDYSDGDAYGGIDRGSYIERAYASERTNSAYNIEDDLHPPPIFDLTPGREPSPARYKHGEPLHFVGEEEEDEDDSY